MSDWRQYYTKAKARKQRKKYYHEHPERMKELREKYKEEHYDKWLEARRKGYKKWISNPENKARKKEYQKEWYQRVKKKSEKEQRQEFYKVRDLLREGKVYEVGENSAELRTDRGGNFFFFIKQKGKVLFMSEKYETETKAIKELMEAI